MSSEVRQRSGKGVNASSTAGSSKGAAPSTRGGVSVLDIARSIVFLFLSSCLLSWFITGKDMFWGHRPPYTKLSFWQDLSKGPVVLTDAQLRKYDGSDPSTPIYLAINGTIYDVTVGRRFYGPEGSYGHFSGADATRAFATSCFNPESCVPDIRGVEEMHLPVDNPEIDSLYTSGQLKSLKEQERRIAKKKVKETLDHWIGFFGTSEKYKTVGYVKREKGWETKGTPPPLCEKAQEGRPVRPPPPGVKVPKKEL